MKIFGGAGAVGRRLATDDDVIALVREGLPYKAFERLSEALDMTVAEVAATLSIPRSNVTRRKSEGRFKREESEKALRLGRVAVRAEEVLGSMEKAYRWLRAPNPALGGKRPIEMLDVDLGAEKVEDILGRIDYGVYS
ncbi:MAG: DUF2384 domain-containing protein [Myxococcaceae bacterium]|nr:DUF2384 domain-containing protein [Myxococcaceae bacterium]